jgi:hypothetical protein
VIVTSQKTCGTVGAISSKGAETTRSIAVSIAEKQLDVHIRPCVSTAKRGYEGSIPLHRIFKHILYRLHTGVSGRACRQRMVETIQKEEESPVTRRTTVFIRGAGMAALNISTLETIRCLVMAGL